MFDQPLIKACVQQQQMLEEVVNPAGPPPDRDALADAVQLLRSHADLLDRTQRRLLFLAGKGTQPDAPATGTLLTSLVQAALARGRLLRRAVERPGTAPVDRAADLDAALDRLERLLAAHERLWPWEPVPTADEVLAAARAGEGQDADAAFAEIAGLDAAAWEGRVADYRRSRAAGGAGA